MTYTVVVKGVDGVCRTWSHYQDIRNAMQITTYFHESYVAIGSTIIWRNFPLEEIHDWMKEGF